MYGPVISYSAHIYDVRVHTRLEYYVPLYASATAGEELFAIQFAYLNVTSKLSLRQTAFD